MKIDLKALLAKIINESSPRLGTWTAISNGFVAPRDGFVRLSCTSSSINSGNCHGVAYLTLSERGCVA